VHVYDGFHETCSRIVFPYADKMMHLASQRPPIHMTILASGAIRNDAAPLYLGGAWKDSELESKTDKELADISKEHTAQQELPTHREELIEALVGTDRDPSLRDSALMAHTSVQTMQPAAAAAHLGISPNGNFVWPRDDGTIAVVHCWRAKYNDTFRTAFNCSKTNPDKSVFSPRMVTEFRQAMRAVFGPAADSISLVYARKTARNPHLVLVGTQEALLEFLRSRSDVVSALGIVEVTADGFLAKVSIEGKSKRWTKRFAIAEQGRSVIYVKEGFESYCCSKPLFLFNADCQFGPEISKRSDLMYKLSDEHSWRSIADGSVAGMPTTGSTYSLRI